MPADKPPRKRTDYHREYARKRRAKMAESLPDESLEDLIRRVVREELRALADMLTSTMSTTREAIPKPVERDARTLDLFPAGQGPTEPDVLASNHVNSPPATRQRKPATPEKLTEVHRLRAEGLSMKSIADALGLSFHRVRETLLEARENPRS